MSCKTVSVRRLPRRLDRHAGNVSVSQSVRRVLTGAFVVLTQVGCLGGNEAIEVTRTAPALTRGQLRNEACIQADQDQLKSFALYASTSLRIGENTDIVNGNVGVRERADLPNNLTERLFLDQRATISTTRRAIAKSIRLNDRAQVGVLETDVFTEGSAVSHGVIKEFPATTPIPPVVAPFTASGSNITVDDDNTGLELDPGDYLAVVVTGANLLNLKGGTYTFRTLELESSAQMRALASSDVTVLESILVRENASISTSGGLSPEDMVLRIPAETTTDNGVVPAVRVLQDADIKALLIAPNAVVAFANDTVLTGAAIFKTGTWGNNAIVRYQDGIPGEDCEPYDCANLPIDDNLPCTADSCDIELGVQHTDLPDGTACTLPGVTAAACLATTCTELCTDFTQTREGSALQRRVVEFDEFPTLDGHYLVEYETGCMKYNPLFFYSVQGVSDGEFSWFIVSNGDTSNHIALLPGTVGFFPGQSGDPRKLPGYNTYAACVAANQALPPIVIEHTDDSTLGIYLEDHPYTDNRVRTDRGEVSPTWSITPFAPCGG